MSLHCAAASWSASSISSLFLCPLLATQSSTLVCPALVRVHVPYKLNLWAANQQLQPQSQTPALTLTLTLLPERALFDLMLKSPLLLSPFCPLSFQSLFPDMNGSNQPGFARALRAFVAVRWHYAGGTG